MQRTPNEGRARLIRAEALLCRGLEDDREALDEAIDGFTDVVGREPENFFARLYLGESISGEWDCPAVKDQGVWNGTLSSAK